MHLRGPPPGLLLPDCGDGVILQSAYTLPFEGVWNGAALGQQPF